MTGHRDFRNYMYSLMNDRENGLIASVLKPLLLAASLVYLACLKIIFLLHHRGILTTTHLQAKVISIGNLTLGGTGKTPLVELVSRILLDSGKKIAILTRGYKIASNDITNIAHKDPFSFEQIGDEPALLRMKLPQADILVGRDRVKNGKAAIYRSGADVLILDDGFQHWVLSRDMDILAIDARNPFGNGMLLPRGILREPLENAARANIIVITKVDAVNQEQVSDIKVRMKALNPDALVVTAVHNPESISEFADSQKLQAVSGPGKAQGLDFLKNKDVVAVSGIGDNDYFIKALKDLGASIKETIFYQDHHPYSFADLEYIVAKCRQAGTRIAVVTEKDMIKIKPLINRHLLAFESFQMQFLAVGVKMQIVENEAKFRELILAK